jgi:hypothetical protein
MIKNCNIKKYRKYQVIHKSMKHLKNSHQINNAMGHDNSYANRERETLQVFFKESLRRAVVV